MFCWTSPLRWWQPFAHPTATDTQLADVAYRSCPSIVGRNHMLIRASALETQRGIGHDDQMHEPTMACSGWDHVPRSRPVRRTQAPTTGDIDGVKRRDGPGPEGAIACGEAAAGDVT